MRRRASRPAAEGGILPPGRSAALTRSPEISKALMISDGFFRGWKPGSTSAKMADAAISASSQGEPGGCPARNFPVFGASVEGLMAPQVFEKSLRCQNNLCLQVDLEIVCDLTFCVVGIQDGGIGPGQQVNCRSTTRGQAALWQRLCSHGRRAELRSGGYRGVPAQMPARVATEP